MLCQNVQLCFKAIFLLFVVMAVSQPVQGLTAEKKMILVTDLAGRVVEISTPAQRLVGINSALSMLCYMNLADHVVGVEYEEKEISKWIGSTGRSYRMANPHLGQLPSVGSRRQLDIEALIQLKPDLILMGWGDPERADRLQRRSGIPVLIVHNGNLTDQLGKFLESLRLIGTTCGRLDRAQHIEEFIRASIDDLRSRAEQSQSAASVYIGGLNFRTAHGLLGTSRQYPPFVLLNANNIADGSPQHKPLAKGRFSISDESLIKADPDIIFVCASGEDLVTRDLSLPAFSTLNAVQHSTLHRIHPHYYAASPDTVLAESYYMGTVLHPSSFKEINLAEKANHLYRFFVGQPLYSDMARLFGPYERIRFTAGEK